MSLTDIFLKTDKLYYCDGKLVYTGFQSAHTVPPLSEFYSINPLAEQWDQYAKMCQKLPVTPRFSLNVSEFKNFVFESDTVELTEQLKQWTKLSAILPIKMLTYSGGKSYHAVISVLDTLPYEPHTVEGVQGYKHAWKALRSFIEAHSTLKLDESTKDPARLTRVPGALRAGSVLQKAEVLADCRYATCNDIMVIIGSHAPPPAYKGHVYTGPAVNLEMLKKLLNLYTHEKLSYRIRRVEKWAGSEGMYPLLLRLTLWAIDELNPDYQAWLALMEEKVFPVIKAHGYNRNLTVPVEAAYTMKGK
jgi:hypothetical protein